MTIDRNEAKAGREADRRYLQKVKDLRLLRELVGTVVFQLDERLANNRRKFGYDDRLVMAEAILKLAAARAQEKAKASSSHQLRNELAQFSIEQLTRA